MSETSTLISCAGKITRSELAQVPTPPSTATHVPIPHAAVVEALVETLSHRQISVVREEWPYRRTEWRCSASWIWPLVLKDADSQSESGMRTISDFGWHARSGYESSCVTILRLGEILVLF